MTNSETLEGGCACGAIRYRVRGTPAMVAYCYCEECRRSSGSVVAVLAGFKREDVTLLAGAPGSYSSTPGVQRGFCTACGSPLSYANESFAENIYLHIGGFDDPNRFPPDRHTWTSECLSWHRINDDLVQYERLSNAGQANNTPPYRGA